MKLLTHNMLQCNKKGCTSNNYPLALHAEEVAREESEFRPEFIKHMLTKLDYSALVLAAKALSIEIPEQLPPNASEDENFLRGLHTALVEVNVKEGELKCQNCSRAFPITKGIPNMLLNEEEVDMDSYKLQAKEKANEYKDTIVEKVDQLKDEVADRSAKVTHTIRDKVTHPYDTIDQARDGFDSVFNAQRLDRAKEKIETDASLFVGYKDQFLGAVKEAFGHMLKDESLKSKGHLQKMKGEAEVKLQKAIEKEKEFQKLRAQIVEVLSRREALLSQLMRMGGFERYESRMHHVEVRERNVADLFLTSGGRTTFALRHYNVQPLLKDIRERNTIRPMVYVNVRERSLLKSGSINPKKDMKFAGRSTLYLDLWAAIRRSDPQKLRMVPRAQVHDRSSPRLDPLRSSNQSRSQLAHVAQPEPVQHFDNGAGVHVKKGIKGKLLDEVRHADVELKHVETVDKSKPALDKDVQLKTWDRQGFLGEVRQGTELKHI